MKTHPFRLPSGFRIDPDTPAGFPAAGPSRRHRITVATRESDFQRRCRHEQAGSTNGSKKT